ncbi:MAG: hypothetical protein NT004_11615 [Bacteroidetes bacterium]|nr:hypothetical protein [Bacteroidota bacterium]
MRQKELAAGIAIREVKTYFETSPVPEKVIFVCFDYENYAIYKELLNL